MATLIKTSVGSWKAMVRKSGWPTTTKTFRTKRDAEDWARNIEDEMVRGVFINRADSHRLKLNVALDRYVSEVSPTRRASTASREFRRTKPLKEHLGDYSLTALTPDVIAKYRDMRSKAGQSASSIRLELSLLSHLFTIAIREWRLGIVYNPVGMVRKPTPPPGRDRRLRKHEERQILAACDAHSNPMLGWIVRVALYTGMRQSEIQTLTLNQVDLNRRIALLKDTKNGSPRLVPLTRLAVKTLRAAIKNPLRSKDTDLIFFGEAGRDAQRRGYEFKPAWFDAMRRAEVNGFRFHDLRHEAVSRLVEAGLGDQEVAAISGHKSMQMLRRYTHLRAEDLVAKLDKLGLR